MWQHRSSCHCYSCDHSIAECSFLYAQATYTLTVSVAYTTSSRLCRTACAASVFSAYESETKHGLRLPFRFDQRWCSLLFRKLNKKDTIHILTITKTQQQQQQLKTVFFFHGSKLHITKYIQHTSKRKKITNKNNK